MKLAQLNETPYEYLTSEEINELIIESLFPSENPEIMYHTTFNKKTKI